ncbi:hypothetical protein EDB89DRAFT_699470 [Lactarius sanguifluus]|nr:hypothetical protein EDB89DRAFT_699470 [Lactarius sanguifluus]
MKEYYALRLNPGSVHRLGEIRTVTERFKLKIYPDTAFQPHACGSRVTTRTFPQLLGAYALNGTEGDRAAGTFMVCHSNIKYGEDCQAETEYKHISDISIAAKSDRARSVFTVADFWGFGPSRVLLAPTRGQSYLMLPKGGEMRWHHYLTLSYDSRLDSESPRRRRVGIILMALQGCWSWQRHYVHAAGSPASNCEAPSRPSKSRLVLPLWRS